MGLVVYTSTGKVKYPHDKQGIEDYQRLGKDLYEDGSTKLFVDVKDGYIRGWFEESTPIQQRFFGFRGPSKSRSDLRNAFGEALEEYFDRMGVSLTKNSENDFLEEYLAGSPSIDLPHNKKEYEKELRSEGILVVVGKSYRGTMEAAREISIELNNISYMVTRLPNGLNDKALSKFGSSTKTRPAPKILAFPAKGAGNGQTFKSYKK